MKLLIGIPSAGNPATPFTESLGRLQLPPAVSAVDHLTVVGNFVPAARELIVRHALETESDVVIMCDDDMVLPEDAVTRLLETLAADVRCALAGALYYAKDGVRPMVTSRWDPADTSKASVPAFATEPAAIEGVGFGCVAIKRDALLALQAPYFEAQVFIQKSVAHVRICNEDYLFCRRLRAAGYTVKLDPRVKCGHFDRAAGVVHPAAWEDPASTYDERMF
ncbi:MAG: hypothetical protein JO347_00335, partial [Candidatus Eremiobacteraeota bacterium]|nr:hypothetical protein [Candidatus Eremiobacteraeota bacterium]